MSVQRALILADENDAHVSALRWALGENGMEVFCAPSMRLNGAARYSIHANMQGVQASGPWGDSTGLRSVWMRVMAPPQIEGLPEFDHKFVHKQWELFQRNTFELARDVSAGLWINHPVNAYHAESKLLQLKIANEVGLLIPDTVVTNDAADVRNMIRRHGKVVFKQFFDYMWRDVAAGTLHSSSPAILDTQTELPEDSIGLCPGIYQRYIQKRFDLRITVIGDRMFAAKLHRGCKEAYVDWRPHVYKDELLMETFTLPAAIETKLRALMSRLNLVFGCIDLVADSDGNFYFLEVNQQGQFLFVEEQVPDLPVMRAMTAMMLTGRTTYSIDDTRPLNFADYLESAEYARILAAPLQKSDIYVVEA